MATEIMLLNVVDAYIPADPSSGRTCGNTQCEGSSVLTDQCSQISAPGSESRAPVLELRVHILVLFLEGKVQGG